MATASAAAAAFLRGSGTSDSRKPAAITKQSSVTTSESICDDAASPSTWWCDPCRRRNQMHAGHRGVVHARHREAVGDRAQRKLHAALPRQERTQAAIGGGDRDQDRQHDHRGVMRHGKIARQSMHADIMHAGDTDPEQHRRGHHAQHRRLADADEEQGNAHDQRADQERHDGRQHQIDRARRQRRRQHADEVHGPDADGEKERGARQQQAMTGVRRPADARGEAEAGVTSQNRDHHRERDEIGIVSFEHDRLGRPSPRACLLPPPSL